MIAYLFRYVIISILKIIDRKTSMSYIKKPPTCLDDILKDDIFGLLDISDEEASLFVEPNYYESRAKASYNAIDGELTARQEACSDFKTYKPIINKALVDLKSLPYNQDFAKERDISVGDILILNGVLACIVAINKSESRASGQKYRAHLVYANETESKLLLSSLVAATHKPNSYLVKFS
jgi:hypothetical protein